MRFVLFFLVVGCSTSASFAAADDYERGSGYPTSPPNYQLDVEHDGYGGVGREIESAEPRSYVVVEADTGTTMEVEGESVVVVQEPEPVAATMQAPPAPRVAPSEQEPRACPSGVWVDGYWDYRHGQYVWVYGHCVEVRVDYVFVAPRWDFYWDTWWFIPGYYRPCNVFVGYGYYRPWHWFPPYPYPYYRTGRPVPVSRGVPSRATVARPVPQSTRVSRGSTTVIHKTPSGATKPGYLGRPGRGEVLTDEGARSRDGIGIVTQPRINPRTVRGAGTTTTRSRGYTGKRSRPSSRGSGWTPSSSSSSGSSKGWFGRPSRSSPSTGRSGGGSSSGARGGRSGKGSR